MRVLTLLNSSVHDIGHWDNILNLSASNKLAIVIYNTNNQVKNTIPLHENWCFKNQ